MTGFHSVILLVSILVTNVASENSSSESHLVVQTKNGPVKGIVKEARGGAKYVAFLGLRYANPAVRFEPSKPLEERWTSPKIADTFGNICPQVNVGEIDCLFLNIYVPQKHLKTRDGSKLPVMFGDGNDYAGDYILETEETILVTINYSLGLLGFLSTGESSGDIQANLGLKDQVNALRYVNENIEGFRGDKTKVTIFGESAGSASVHYLLMTPSAEGLFTRAIMQSGVHSFWSYVKNPREAALKIAKEFLSCDNVKDDAEDAEQSIQIRDCLEKTDLNDLLFAQHTFWPQWPATNPMSRFVPSADEASQDPFFASCPVFSQSGNQNVYHSTVPVIIGVAADEGATAFAALLYQSEKDLQQLNNEWEQLAPLTFMFKDIFPAKNLVKISKKIKDFYFGSKPISLENKQALADLYSDSWFLLPSLATADEMARNGMPVYPYLFTYWGGWSLRKMLTGTDEDIYTGQAGHADDVRFLFPHPIMGPPLEPGSEAEEFSRSFVKLWTSFAKTGKPTVEWNNGKAVEWNPIKSQNGSPLNFDVLKIDKEPPIINLDVKDRVEFWRSIYRYYSEEKEAKESKTEL